MCRNKVSDSRAGGDCRGEKQYVVFQNQKSRCSRDSADKKSREQHEVKPDSTAINGLPSRELADGDAEIGDDAGDVGRADDGATVSCGHGILKTACHRCDVRAGSGTAVEKTGGPHEQGRFEHERSAVRITTAKRGMFDDQATDHAAGEE